MRKYNTQGIAPFVVNTIGDVESRTIIRVHTDGGVKKVHFFGYGYEAGNGYPLDYRFLEYTSLYADAKTVIAVGGLSAWERKNQEFCTQYISEHTDKDIVSIYTHYDNGNAPVGFLKDAAFSETTPDGFYVVDPTPLEIEISFSARFNREIVSDVEMNENNALVETGDYLCTGGYEMTMGGKTFNFDFYNCGGDIDKEDASIVHFFAYNLDCDSFPYVLRMTEEDINNITNVTEIFVYTGEDDEESDMPFVTKILDFSFFLCGSGDTVEVPQEVIDKYNILLAEENKDLHGEGK